MEIWRGSFPVSGMGVLFQAWGGGGEGNVGNKQEETGEGWSGVGLLGIICVTIFYVLYFAVLSKTIRVRLL